MELSLFVCDSRGLEVITSPLLNVSWLENVVFTLERGFAKVQDF